MLYCSSKRITLLKKGWFYCPFWLFVLGTFLLSNSYAFIVSDIDIAGLQRVSTGTVYNVLPIEVGHDVSNKDITAAIHALFRTGYFTDIHIGRDANKLVVSVVERPAISKMDIKGNKAIKTKGLKKALSAAGLEQGEIFQQDTLEAIRQEVERLYIAQGRYSAKVTLDVLAQPHNRVEIVININEGSVAKIRYINIVGNSAFSKEELLENFQLKVLPWYSLSFFNSANKYSQEKLTGDIERLRFFYMDKGFLNCNVLSTQVSLSPDKKGVYITVNIIEGKEYVVSDLKFAGDMVIPEKELSSLLAIKSGQMFSRKQVVKTEELLVKRMGNDGYTFAQVTSLPTINESDNTVLITFFIDKGHRYYVRRINFYGNTATDSEVLRREMRQMEGASANGESIEQSKLRLERLGYFKNVLVDTTKVPGTQDQLDINYSVEEQPSGRVSLSVGFSQSDGLLLNAGVSQSNFLGTGNDVSFNFSRSKVNQTYSFGYNNPYYTVEGVSRGFDVYYKTTNYKDSEIASYAMDTIGGDVSFSYPISETQAISFGGGVEKLLVKTGQASPGYIARFISDYGKNFLNYKGVIGWSQSALNRGMLPTRGYGQSLFFQVTGPGSGLNYYKLDYNGQYFYPLTESFTARFSLHCAYGGAYGKTKTFPFLENYYAGGFGSVRGYTQYSLGAKVKDSKRGEYNSVGGNVLTVGTVEILFPLPFIKEQSSLRTSLFFDVGNVFSTSFERGTSDVVDDSRPKFAELRYSVGVGLVWITPLGPLTFSLGKALNAKGQDETEVFQFSLGASF